MKETDQKNNVHENSEFFVPTSVCQTPSLNSTLPVDNFLMKDAKYNTVSSEIPSTFFVNTSLISTSMGQYDKFKFPSRDNPLSKAGEIEIPKLESLEYIVNLLVGKLDLDLKKEWDEIAERDTSVPELSSNGLQLTKYDIRQLCANFRKAREKEMYVHKISGNLSVEKSLNSSNKQKFQVGSSTQSHLVNVFAAKIKTPTEGLTCVRVRPSI